MVKCVKCNGERTVFDKGAWSHCECVDHDKVTLNLARMGIASSVSPIYLKSKDADPTADKWYNKSLYIWSKDVRNVLVPVVSGIFLKALEDSDRNRCYFTTAYGLVRTYLGKDEIHSDVDSYIDYSHMAVMVNFADSSPNRLTNSLLRHVYENRVLRKKNTYIVSNVPRSELPAAYTEDDTLYQYICELSEVDLDTKLGRKA